MGGEGADGREKILGREGGRDRGRMKICSEEWWVGMRESPA